ncbi:hypothetical protein A0H81_06453 [Grifola frondosa]|uniref:Uncharacterized protein n=1 Tax=Grifola frondosa TaxID=5627 RepID=A0A1C7MAD9_GRIFR|nr:hypothetical protein A0H81_06453 [Grifola frondosa]
MDAPSFFSLIAGVVVAGFATYMQIWPTLHGPAAPRVRWLPCVHARGSRENGKQQLIDSAKCARYCSRCGWTSSARSRPRRWGDDDGSTVCVLTCACGSRVMCRLIASASPRCVRTHLRQGDQRDVVIPANAAPTGGGRAALSRAEHAAAHQMGKCLGKRGCWEAEGASCDRATGCCFPLPLQPTVLLRCRRGLRVPAAATQARGRRTKATGSGSLSIHVGASRVATHANGEENRRSERGRGGAKSLMIACLVFSEASMDELRPRADQGANWV